MPTDRFHNAAKDGLIEVLREATRKECNHKDESGMTPTLWAAFEGHAEALRLLCGRGGEPDKADIYGNTALHLAAARGHKNCVTYLFKFGANLYSTTCDGHTAQQLAAINGRDDILRYLDNATAKLESYDKKKAKFLKEKAKKDHEKSQQEYGKWQSKSAILAEKEMQKMKERENGYGEEMENTMPHRSTTQGNHPSDKAPRPTFTSLVGTLSSSVRGHGAVYKKALASKLRKNNGPNVPHDDFKVGEVEDTGRRSVMSLNGLRRDSEVMFLGSISAGAQPRTGLGDVFEAPDPPADERADQSVSQPDFRASAVYSGSISQEMQLQDSSSLFVRPGFGRIVFRHSILATIKGATPVEGGAKIEELSNKSASSLAQQAYEPADCGAPESDDEISDEKPVEESAYASSERFLLTAHPEKYAAMSKDEEIDSHHRKLVAATQERKQALTRPRDMEIKPTDNGRIKR